MRLSLESRKITEDTPAIVRMDNEETAKVWPLVTTWIGYLVSSETGGLLANPLPISIQI